MELSSFRAAGRDEREHARELDQELGFNIEPIEAALLQRARTLAPDGSVQTWGQRLHGAQTWIGLHEQTLQTPYEELSRMCDYLAAPEKSHIVDLGAGYGRLGLLLHYRYPEARFTGYELVSERVLEGQRVLALHGCQRARLVLQDLTADSFIMPVADCYLIYDYGTLDHLRHTMGQLAQLASTERFQVIARGGTIRSLIQHAHPWLWDVGRVHHEEKFSVYTNYL